MKGVLPGRKLHVNEIAGDRKREGRCHKGTVGVAVPPMTGYQWQQGDGQKQQHKGRDAPDRQIEMGALCRFRHARPEQNAETN